MDLMDTISSWFEAALGLSLKAEQLNAIQVCFRALTVYIILIVYVRCAKKRFLGQATALDAILLIMIGSIASRAISGTAPFAPSLAGTAALVAIHWVISYLTQDWKTLSDLIKGHDTTLICEWAG
jgi:uncharacterized membrane protein YcaP (DUF421 family)